MKNLYSVFRWRASILAGAFYSVLLVLAVLSLQGNLPITSAAPPPGTPTGSGWSDDGFVVRLTSISDNVGIGTASPTGKLSVIGNASIDGNLTVNSGTVSLPIGQIDNIELANSSIAVNTDGTLAVTGSPVSLGGSVSVSLNTANSNIWTASQIFSSGANREIIANGKIYSEGIILKATDGPNCYLLSVDNAGTENKTQINCDGTPIPTPTPTPTPTPAPSIQTFTSSGTFIKPAGITNFHVLVVGGGGGGGGDSGGVGGTGIIGQGNNGGSGSSSDGGAEQFGGGGGGRGGVGENATTIDIGTGGPGLSSSITGSFVTYAKGGDGGEPATGSGANGIANTGNGGGGAGTGVSGGLPGGSGGSGIIIITWSL